MLNSTTFPNYYKGQRVSYNGDTVKIALNTRRSAMVLVRHIDGKLRGKLEYVAIREVEEIEES